MKFITATQSEIKNLVPNWEMREVKKYISSSIVCTDILIKCLILMGNPWRPKIFNYYVAHQQLSTILYPAPKKLVATLGIRICCLLPESTKAFTGWPLTLQLMYSITTCPKLSGASSMAMVIFSSTLCCLEYVRKVRHLKNQYIEQKYWKEIAFLS